MDRAPDESRSQRSSDVANFTCSYLDLYVKGAQGRGRGSKEGKGEGKQGMEGSRRRG